LKRIDFRYGLWAAGLLLVTAAPGLAGFVGLGWEVSQIVGLISAIACILLCGCPLRPRNAVPPTLLTLQSHQYIGWLALIAAALHMGGLLVADRTVVEYLKPATPLYQWAGILALVLLMVMVASSVTRARQRLWKGHRGFQATHVSLGCVLLVLVTIHVAVTHRYVGGGARQIIFGAVTAGAILLLLRARRVGVAAGSIAAARRLVFGRHSKWIAFIAIVSGAAVAVVFLPRVQVSLRESLWHRELRLPLIFPHEKHATVNCLICHHNYADGRGADSCVPCHRSARADLKAGAESRFHGFCLDCHRHPSTAFKGKHGPVSGCHTCHRLDSSTLIASSDAATPLK